MILVNNVTLSLAIALSFSSTAPTLGDADALPTSPSEYIYATDTSEFVADIEPTIIRSDFDPDPIENIDQSDGHTAFMSNETPYIKTKCYAKTYRPHKSTKHKNQASAHGDSWCDSRMDYIQTITHIARKRWFGYEKLSTDKKSASNRSRPKRHATPHHYCKGQGKYWYVGYSTHFAQKKLNARDTVIFNKSTKNEGTEAVSQFDC